MRYHLPHLDVPGHDFVIKIEHLLCDKRFWFAVGITLLLAGLFVLVIWAAQSGSSVMGGYPYSPFYPKLP